MATDESVKLKTVADNMAAYNIADYDHPLAWHVYVESWFAVKDGKFFVYLDHSVQMNSNRSVVECLKTVTGSEPMFLKLYLKPKWLWHFE